MCGQNYRVFKLLLKFTVTVAWRRQAPGPDRGGDTARFGNGDGNGFSDGAPAMGTAPSRAGMTAAGLVIETEERRIADQRILHRGNEGRG